MAPAKASDTLIYPWMGSQVVLREITGFQLKGTKMGARCAPIHLASGSGSGPQN